MRGAPRTRAMSGLRRRKNGRTCPRSGLRRRRCARFDTTGRERRTRSAASCRRPRPGTARCECGWKPPASTRRTRIGGVVRRRRHLLRAAAAPSFVLPARGGISDALFNRPGSSPSVRDQGFESFSLRQRVCLSTGICHSWPGAGLRRYRETAKVALIHVADHDDDESESVGDAIRAPEGGTAEDRAELESDQAMTEKALALLKNPSSTAYSRALAALR